MKSLSQEDKNNLRNINRKIGINFFAIFVFIITTIILVTFLVFQNVIKSSEDRLSENITNVLSISISRISFSGKYHAQIFSDQLIEREKSIQYIIIINSEGEVVSNSYNKQFEDFIERTHLPNLKKYIEENSDLENKDRTISYINCCNGQKIKEIIMPYYGNFDQGQIGVIITGISVLKTTKEITNSRLTLLCFGLIITIIGIILIYVITKRISAPIMRLATMFQGILAHAPISIMVKDLEGNVIAESEEYKKLFIKNSDQFIDKSQVDDIFGTDKNTNSLVIQDTFTKKEILTHDIGPLSILYFKLPLLDSAGKIYGICGMATDITQKDRAEKALLKSEADFRSIFELSPVGIANISRHGDFIRANRSLETILGYTEEELQRLKFSDVIYPDEETFIMENQADYAEVQKRCISKTGKIIWIQVYISTVRNEDGELLHYIVIMDDVTEQKIAEETREKILRQEQEARHEAQKAVAIREEFLSVASHELKTPLTALTLQIQLINRLVKQERFKDLSFEKRSMLTRLSEQNLQRFSKLIDDLLDVTRISRSHLIINKEEVNLTELIKEVIGRFQMELQSSGSHIEFEYETDIFGYWERLRIDQVITNLLSNAIKFGEGKKIIINQHVSGDSAILSVQDFGIGISKENQIRIFEQFERAVSSKSFGGLGLGLYIVKQIVEGHKGRITVESEPGKGSKFTVELPLKLIS